MYWVINGISESIEIYRTPEGDRYREVRRVAGDSTVTLPAFPDVASTPAEVFA